MAQIISSPGLVGKGIVAVLIVTGVLLYVFGIRPDLAGFSLMGGIGLAFVLGFLGVFAVAKRVVR